MNWPDKPTEKSVEIQPGRVNILFVVSQNQRILRSDAPAEQKCNCTRWLFNLDAPSPMFDDRRADPGTVFMRRFLKIHSEVLPSLYRGAIHGGHCVQFDSSGACFLYSFDVS
jgi:hypothetical protein